MHKESKLRYNAPRISHAVAGLIPNLAFHTEDPDGVRITMKILVFPNLSLSESSESVLVARWWDTALDSRMMTTYTNTASLLGCQKVAPIVIWEASNIML